MKENTIKINNAVKKYMDGDKKAFTEIYELTYQATYYYILGSVKNPDAADDIISDTYLQVVKSIGSLSSPEAFVSWLRTIAHSKICKYFKKNGREVLVTEEEEPIFDTLKNENEEFIPAVALEKESDKNEIIRIINGLSDVQKQTVFMYYFDKMPITKVAEVMECSENTVKSRLNYARKALKEMFVAEEKKGNKFYSIAPFMFMLFSEEVQAVRVSAELSKRIIECAEVGAATAAGSGIIGTIKGFFSTVTGK
ncbi:MAG: RNA polymerase sigma factor, partial [Oscillospiraceae bacterium]|nr:RNA polymerase sigma factor [Oscillospiraceae bacterium]